MKQKKEGEVWQWRASSGFLLSQSGVDGGLRGCQKEQHGVGPTRALERVGVERVWSTVRGRLSAKIRCGFQGGPRNGPLFSF